jgi:spore maturation protein CgeB
MLGACYLTEYTDGVAALYDLGKEVETYKSTEELVHKLEDLSKSPDKRKRLRVAGQSRALSSLTVAATLKRICDRIGSSDEEAS